ncbi:Photosystem I chlorophyll a apoprotein A1 [Capsicum baccatum]|uniref:Photosystem I chlorophyll a apoprotein A1 n=1 Tax=Capsicum baccatum TaxID=33114 RepID=A0A2G2VNE4_CAPBA|nr:Photosystem I chlorophyll a apoprotein A1 [Capsicum baccatum]
MPPYPYLATDYGTQLSLFTYHMWISGFLIVGAVAHATIFMVRDYDPTTRYNDLLDRVLRHHDSIISHLNWACIFLGFHSFGLYIHNYTISAFGRPQDMFPIGKVALFPIPLGTTDFLVHHIYAFMIHVTILILLKGVVFARSSHLIPDKANLGFCFTCDEPGRGGTYRVSAWDHVFLGLFWMYNSISVVIFHFSWKMQLDVWDNVSDQGVVTYITGGNFAQSSITINGWLRDFLWAQASQDPLHVRPIAHAIWDPHFGQPAVEAFTRGGALAPVNIAYSGDYQWWYTIGLRTNQDLSTGTLFVLFFSAMSLIAGLFGVISLAWTGHLVHVSIPASRGEYVQWNNFLDILPHPQGLGPLFTGQWNLYAQNPYSSSHLFGTAQGAGTAILTLLRGFYPQTQSLWLTDIAQHHLAIAFIFSLLVICIKPISGLGTV